MGWVMAQEVKEVLQLCEDWRKEPKQPDCFNTGFNLEVMNDIVKDGLSHGGANRVKLREL